jgi:NAD(P)-dependent dehydrogenase (short-subunit alcohol dehydrogenase family)
MTSMDGKVALVTGAASGIGRATAIGLARDGATVVLLVRNAERGEQALHDVRAGAPDSRVEALEVVVKRGAQGALSLVAGELHSAPAVPVDVVDTVGAGDAFVAGTSPSASPADRPPHGWRSGSRPRPSPASYPATGKAPHGAKSSRC